MLSIESFDVGDFVPSVTNKCCHNCACRDARYVMINTWITEPVDPEDYVHDSCITLVWYLGILLTRLWGPFY